MKTDEKGLEGQDWLAAELEDTLDEDYELEISEYEREPLPPELHVPQRYGGRRPLFARGRRDVTKAQSGSTTRSPPGRSCALSPDGPG